MTQVTDFLSPKDLTQISNLQVLARLVVEGFCSGLHRSPHKGFSVEFKQHRPYVPGDDLRYLDWKVYGKTDRFYIREYEEETNLRATILLDCSGSMGYTGRNGVSKHHYATRLAACLSYLMLQQSDSIGMVRFDSRVRRYIPPRSRAGHLRILIDEMQQSQTAGETELGTVLHELAPRLNRRGLVVLISDCFGDVPALLAALAHLRHARHEIIIFQVWDPDELTFPFRQWMRFDSLEVAGFHHLVDPATLRKAYMANLERYRDDLTRGCRRHRVDLVPMTTDQSYAEALAWYLSLRRRRS